MDFTFSLLENTILADVMILSDYYLSAMIMLKEQTPHLSDILKVYLLPKDIVKAGMLLNFWKNER
jgi:hypothetical protein